MKIKTKLLSSIFTTLVITVCVFAHVRALDDAGFLFNEAGIVACDKLPADAAAAYRDITGQPGGGACHGGMAPVDLNADGSNEYIFFISNGDARLYYVISKGSARWDVIAQLNEDSIYQIGPGLNGGYYDILTRNSLEDMAWARYAWDGRRYHETPLAAAPQEKRVHYRVTAPALRVRQAAAADADVRLTLPAGACVSSSRTVTDDRGGKWVRLDDYVFTGERGTRAAGMAAAAELSPSDACAAAFALVDVIYEKMETQWRRNFESRCASNTADVAALHDLTVWLLEHTAENVDVETRLVSSERAAVVYNETKLAQQAASTFVDRAQELFGSGLSAVARSSGVCGLLPERGLDRAARAAFDLLIAPRIGESDAVAIIDDRSDPDRIYSWLFRNTGTGWILSGLNITVNRVSDDASLFAK